MSMFLSSDELADLTGKTRSAAQIRALRSMGIEHRIRADGKPVVLREHVEQLLGAKKAPVRKPKSGQPNWSAA